MEKLGPAPTPLPAPAWLSPARQAVLGWLRAATEPVLVADAATSLGLHPNTTREHLDALCAAGLASRSRAQTGGRGRPPWAYRAAPEAAPRELREYVGLVSALAEHVLRTSEHPSEDARHAGRTWGAGLLPRQQLPPRRRAAQTLHQLDELGFSPTRPDAHGVVALRTCPLLEVAAAYPEVVCAVHLGLIEGALSALGRPDDDLEPVELAPFSDPGSCRLQIPLDETASVGAR